MPLSGASRLPLGSGAGGGLRRLGNPRCPTRSEYRLYLGRGGECLVRYDNETGKGDHRHAGGKEMPYRFVSVAQLRRDFEADVRKYGGKDEKEDPDRGR